MTLSSCQRRTCDAPATATRVLRITPGRVRRTFGHIPSSHIVKDGIRRLVFFSAMHLCRDDTLIGQCRTCDAPATATPVLRMTPGRVRRTFGPVPSSHIVKDGIRRLVFPSAMHLCRDDTLVASTPNVRRTRHCHSRTSHHVWAGASHVRARPVKPHRQGQHPPARLLLRHAPLPR